MKYALAALLVFCLGSAALAANGIGVILTLCSGNCRPASPTATPTPIVGAISFVGRTQANNNAANSAIGSIAIPTGTAQNDFLVMEVVSNIGTSFANGLPPEPMSGWQQCSPTDVYTADGKTVTGISNSANKTALLYYRNYVSSMGSSVANPGGTTLGFPKAIMRAYHSSAGGLPLLSLDTCSLTPATVGKISTGASTLGTSMTLTAQSPTIGANEWFTGFFVQDAGAVTAPAGLSNVTADGTQYFTADGDLGSPTVGTVVSGLTATATSGNWLGFGVSFWQPPANAAVTEVPPIAAPAGFQWVLSGDDEYNYINWTNYWNGDEYLIPWGATPNINTFNGIAIVSGGIEAMTGTLNPANLADRTGRVDEETVGKFSQRYGYFEWSMKLPTDNAHEGDGHYLTNWMVPVTKTSFPASTGNPCGAGQPDTGNEEVDLDETILAINNMTNVYAAIHDCNFGEYIQNLPVTSVGNLSQAFHRYGLYWANDGTPHGTMSVYFDGVKQGASHVLDANSAKWDSGLIFLNQTSACPPGNVPFDNGVACNASSSSNNPWFIDYFRAWQLTPVASTPTPTPTPAPTAAPTNQPTASPTPSPTPKPTASPTPGNGNSTTADPQANSHARAELAWLIQQENSGGNHHVSQSSQGVVKLQVATLSQQISGDGGNWPGMMGVDYCNAAWGDHTTGPCSFGSGSDSNVAAKQGWAQHAIVVFRMDFPNPKINPNNQSANALGHPGNNAGTACPGGGGDNNDPGAAYDCTGGMNAAYVQQMLTAGTAANTQWHQELNQWVSGFQDLQNNGIVVIAGMFQEADSTAFWWGPQLTGSQQANLFIQTEQYFESQGLHNILYSHCILAGVSGYPGNQWVDVEGVDLYPAANGGNFIAPQYNDVVGFGKPIVVEEYQPAQNGVYPGVLSNFSFGMPKVVGMNEWTFRPDPKTNQGDNSWQSMLNETYSSLAKNQPAF